MISASETLILSDYTKLLVEGNGGETRGNHLRLNLFKMTSDTFCIQAVTPTYFFFSSAIYLSIYLLSSYHLSSDL